MLPYISLCSSHVAAGTIWYNHIKYIALCTTFCLCSCSIWMWIFMLYSIISYIYRHSLIYFFKIRHPLILYSHLIFIRGKIWLNINFLFYYYSYIMCDMWRHVDWVGCIMSKVVYSFFFWMSPEPSNLEY